MLDSHGDPSWLSRCCPAMWRSCSFGSAGTALSHAAAVLRWSGYWGGPIQLWLLAWVWVVIGLASPPALPHRHHQDGTTVLFLLAQPMHQTARSGVCSPSHGPSGSPRSYQLSSVAQVRRCPTLLNADAGEGEGQLSSSPA